MTQKRLALLIIAVSLLTFYAFNTGTFKTSQYTGMTKYRAIEKETIEKLKYILQWTSPKTEPFVFMGVGQKGFKDQNCPYTNCYVTADKNLLADLTKFDVIAFHGPEVRKYLKDRLPKNRSLHQKYVFGSMESLDYYPVCKDYLNNFFNWTWTYKLDSDLRWGYIVVRDKEDNIIGPNKIMHWIKPEDMQPVSDEIKKILVKKKKTAAWFVSNCYSKSKRELFVKKLRTILQSKYSLDVDICGKCGKLSCPRDDERVCDEMIRNDYHFYLAFENSFSEDYVTEKLLRAMEFNAIPIVFGGANYSRFLPEGSYLNARELGEEKLAAKMNKLIHNKGQYIEFFKWTNHYRFLPEGSYLNARELGEEKLAAKMNKLIHNKRQYIEFFKWTNHYRYHGRMATLETNNYCSMCALLNDESKVKQTSIYKDFKSWWNAGRQTTC